MKLSQKKTCNGCKSLDASGGRAICDLGGLPECTRWLHGRAIDFSPATPCYKPKTNDEWIEARKIIREKRNSEEG